MVSINKGDNTGAFGYDFLRIYLNNPNNVYISKAVFQINNDLEKIFYEPKFPLRVNFSGAETRLLKQVNKCMLALWDGNGRRRTAEGSLTFFTKENHIKEPDDPAYDDQDIINPEDIDNSIVFTLEDSEFAAQFSINVVPTKMSELEQDVYFMTPANIVGGKNIHTFLNPNGDVVIEASLDTTISWKDVTDKPTINGMPLIGDVEIHLEEEIPNADWDATEGQAEILNKPTFATVAYTGSYKDLIEKPTIATKVSELENDLGFITDSTETLENYYTKEQVDTLIIDGDLTAPLVQELRDLEEKHKEDIDDIENALSTKAEIDYVNTKADKDYVDDLCSLKLDKSDLGNGKLSIYENNSLLNSFTANSSKDVTIDITVPTKVSDLKQDIEYVTKDEIDFSNIATKEDIEDIETSLTTEYATKDDIGAGILTLQQNGYSIGTFSANTLNNKIINIETPTKLSDLEIDLDLLTEEDLKEINNKLNEVEVDVSDVITRVNSFQTQIDNKVDVEAGKSLVSDSLIKSLEELHNYDDTHVLELIQANTDLIAQVEGELVNKVDVEEGKGLSTNDFTDDEQDKLDTAFITTQELKEEVYTIQSTVTKHTTQITENTNDIEDLKEQVSNEITTREDTDNYLQEQIDGLTAKSSVTDIVAQFADLASYDTSKLISGDIIEVLCDETQNDVSSYYRWDGEDFLYIGSEGEYYTKAAANERFVPQTRTINGYALDEDVRLTYEDVHALSETTIIGDGTVTVQRNKVSLGTFTLNQEDNATINIDVPEAMSELTNDLEFIDMETLRIYIGDVPDDNSLQDQVDALKELELTDAADIVALRDLLTGSLDGLPTVALTGDYNDLINKPTIPEYTSQLTNDSGFITMDDVTDKYTPTSELPTKLSEFENDRGYVTNSAIGRGVTTLLINGAEVGTWMANEKDDYTLNIPVDAELSDVSTLPVQNNTITNKLKEVDDSCVHLQGNENIVDTKTFETVNIEISATAPTVETDDNSINIATTEYVKNQDYCTNTDAVHKEGTETITGDKTFTGLVTLSAADGITMAQSDSSQKLATTEFVKIQDYCTNDLAVHRYYDENIQGDKTFSDTTTFTGATYLGDYAHTNTPVAGADNYSIQRVVNVEYVLAQKDELLESISQLQDTDNQTQENISQLQETISKMQETIDTLQEENETRKSENEKLEEKLRYVYEFLQLEYDDDGTEIEP